MKKEILRGSGWSVDHRAALNVGGWTFWSWTIMKTMQNLVNSISASAEWHRVEGACISNLDSDQHRILSTLVKQ